MRPPRRDRCSQAAPLQVVQTRPSSRKSWCVIRSELAEPCALSIAPRGRPQYDLKRTSLLPQASPSPSRQGCSRPAGDKLTPGLLVSALVPAQPPPCPRTLPRGQGALPRRSWVRSPWGFPPGLPRWSGNPHEGASTGTGSPEPRPRGSWRPGAG